jgi:hypothetical protein
LVLLPYHYLEGMFLQVISMHGWKGDVISDNFYVYRTYALTPFGSKVMAYGVRTLQYHSLRS